MVTVRTYLYLFQAQLEKSLLDDYEIFCVLWDENAHTIRAPFAIPVRLVVADAQAEAATLALQNDVDRLAQCLDLLSERESIDSDTVEPIEHAAENANPWELLVAAFYFFVPALGFLQIPYPDANFFNRVGFSNYLIGKVTIAHFLGWIAVILAAFLTVAYFLTRRRQTELTQKSDVSSTQPPSGPAP